VLVAALAAGYATTLVVIEAFDNTPVTTEHAETARQGIVALMARWRWFWIPPLYALALVFLLIVTLTRGASTAQFMYNKF
jgi:hypothetical protein